MTFDRLSRALVALLMAGALAACSSPGGRSSTTPPARTGTAELVVVTHDSFALPDDLKARFAADNGLDVTYVAPGDGGALVNQLILTKDSPLGDVVFGIDNTFAGRATAEGVIATVDGQALVPIDFGDVCINADLTWFAEQHLAVPATLDDLTRPEYKDLLVVSNPASSTPGLAFLAATVGAKGTSGYLAYWDSLVANGVKVVPGWTEAYYTEFSGADGKGPRPLVLSYSTSPAFTLNADKTASTTTALLDTCFRQTEYAGVISGARNEAGARKFIEFLLSPEVQAAIPENMYMYPADTSVALPEEWAKFAPLSKQPIEVSESDITANRDDWIRAWTTHVTG